MGKTHSTLKFKHLQNADVPVVAGQWSKVGELVIPIKQLIEIGYDTRQDYDCLGRAYFDPKNTSDVALEGALKIMIEDSNGGVLNPSIFDQEAVVLRQGGTTYKERYPNPKCGSIASENRVLGFYFKSDTTDTLDVDNTTLEMSIERTIL